MISKEVRVRFAPSPTGYLHVGGARTVLFNWLFAKHTGGKFILRIEDTDTERSTREHERMQIEDIKWLGFDYDEGPDVGGPHAPYRQSERLDIYKKYAEQLLGDGRAFHCFCSDELLTQKREAAMKDGQVAQYDGTCHKVTKEEVARRLASGEKASVRFKAPVREYKLNDAIRGEVIFQPNMVGDFVILRQTGMPVYNFCCVIDDHLMQITHVLRAEEHLSNTVRQMMLYESYGWEMPVMAHASLILGADRSKLSKRHGATSVHQYAEEGFLRDALVNFLSLLGWSSPEGKEILTREEMVKQFTLERINKAPSVFDPVKLKWMNGEYIRAMPIADVVKFVRPYLEASDLPVKGKDQAWLERALSVVRGHFETLADAPKHLRVFFDETFAPEPGSEVARNEPTFVPVVTALRDALAAHVAGVGDAITAEDFAKIEAHVKATAGAKGKGLFMPIRVATTGQLHGPELKLVIPVLGAKSALARVERALAGN